jgi:hypothetical protein
VHEPVAVDPRSGRIAVDDERQHGDRVEALRELEEQARAHARRRAPWHARRADPHVEPRLEGWQHLSRERREIGGREVLALREQLQALAGEGHLAQRAQRVA